MTVNKIKHIQIWISHDFENEKRELYKFLNSQGKKLYSKWNIKKRKTDFELNLTWARADYCENKINNSTNIQKTKKTVWDVINSELGNKNQNPNKISLLKWTIMWLLTHKLSQHV